MRHLSPRISDVRRALLEAAGIPFRLDCLIDQRIMLTTVSPPDGPYREAPSKRIEGTVSGLTFDTILDTRPRLRLYVASAAHGDVQAWFIEGAWYLDEHDMQPRPITFEFPEDPLLIAGRIIAATCPEWQPSIKRFILDGEGPVSFLEHLGTCLTCQTALDKLFKLQCEHFDLSHVRIPSRTPT